MSGAMLAPPSSTCPRRPTLPPSSLTRPSPYPTGGGAGPSRPGMSRTYSFCATSSSETYRLAASSSKPPVPVATTSTERGRGRHRQRGRTSSIPMERSISSQGLDGVQLGHLLQDRKFQQRHPGPVPSIVIEPSVPVQRPSHLALPDLSPISSSLYSAHSTPGPLTPGTPFGSRTAHGQQVLIGEGEQMEEMLESESATSAKQQPQPQPHRPDSST